MANHPKQQGTNGSNNLVNNPKKNIGNEDNNLTTPLNDGNRDKQGTLRAVFEKGLKDMYNAEKQILKALPEIAKAAYHEEFQEILLGHLEETKRHSERLEKLFVRLKIEKTEEKNLAVEGLIQETDKIISEFEEGPVRDAALIVCVQKVEHYEIAMYGSLCEFADILGFQRIADVLDRSLEDEKNADEWLSQIAMEINEEALHAEQEVY